MTHTNIIENLSFSLPTPARDQVAPRFVMDAAAIDDARQQLAAWLLSPMVARADRDGAVGIVNWLAGTDDAHDGLYPEIGGYYLSFLAQVAGHDAPEASCRALAHGVLTWFDRSGADGAPTTIERRCTRAGDWRNQCLFTFDLAMIVRGMIAVEHRWPGIVPPALLARYADAAEAVGEHGLLASHRLRADAAGAVIPVKWSTQIDVHHVKAAAALQGADHVVAVRAATTLDVWRNDERRPVRELHPALYQIEGWLIAWARDKDPGDLARAAAAFASVLGTIDPITLDLPAVAGEGFDESRGDAQAQMLRAGLILDRAEAFDIAMSAHWHRLLPGITANLIARIAPAGGVMFDRRSGHRNSWASMFAWQALALVATGRAATPVEDAARLI